MRIVEKIKAEYAAELDKAAENGKKTKAQRLRAELVDTLTRGISTDRIEAICAAEKDGLVPICPVKLHQHIFRVFHGEVYEEIVCNAMYEPFTPRPRWKIWTMGGGMPYYWRDAYGVTLFFSRPDAEAALAEKARSNE